MQSKRIRANFSAPALVLASLLALVSGVWAAQASASYAEVPLLNMEAVRGGYSLVGRWQFQPGDNMAWAEPGLDDSNWSGMEVPAPWPDGGFPDTGQIAWYRLTLKLDADNPLQRQNLAQLGVRMGRVHSAYELYAGGKLLGGVGKLPPLSEINYDRQRVFQIPSDVIAADGTLVLALRVWGGEDAQVNEWIAGPYGGQFRLGEFRRLVLSGIMAEIPGLVINALFIGFGLYHLYLYRRNPGLETYLWFGLMAINIGFYGLMLNQWKFVMDLSFITLKKMEFGAIYLFPALAIQAVWSLLDQPIGRWLRAYQMGFVAFSVTALVVPGQAVHYHTLQYWQYLVLPLMVLAPRLIFVKLREGNAEAHTLVVGCIIFLAICVNDMLIDLAKVQTTRLLPFGFLAIMLSMAVSLANRFTAMFNELESKVAERTAELSAANEQLAEAARIDPLTGILNRRGFAEEAEAEVQRVLRSGRGFSLVLADVDKFKRFNDHYGHACGDHVLARGAAIIRSSVRDVDRVARWGGEEFIILLPETEVDGAAILAEKLREAIAGNLFEFGGQRLSITMTFGIAAHRQGETLESCLARADTALYHGKEQGRNKVMIGNYKGLTLVN